MAIQSFAVGKTLPDYHADRMFRSAVERQFEIIGEALRRLANLDPAMASRIGEYERIISFRNVIAHGYDVLDDAAVWQPFARSCQHSHPKRKRFWMN